MKYPKFKRYSIIALTILLAIIVIAKCLPTPTQANAVVGPPTIEMHLANINSAIAMNTRIVLGAFSIISGLIIYIFKSTVSNIKEKIQDEIAPVDRKAERALEKTDAIEKEFMSISTHDRICREVNK